MFFSSIRFKIISIYIIFTAGILIVFSVILYRNYQKTLYNDLDEILEAKADGVADAVDTYMEVDNDNTQFGIVARELVIEKTADPRLTGMIIRIFDRKGFIIASSPNTPAHLSPSITLSERAPHDIFFNNISIAVPDGRPLLLRSIVIPVFENNELHYTVQAVAPLNNIISILHKLKIKFFIFVPVSLVLLTFLGFIFAKVILLPITTIIATARQITGENMALRINIPDTHDEIKMLADTFNTMLDKLENAFSLQRQFIEDMSHELRTPLTIIKGELEVMLRRSRSEEEYEQAMKSNLEEINRIHRILEDLLLLARFDNKDIGLNLQKVELSRLLADSVHEVNVLAKEKAIMLKLIAEEPIVIHADREKMRRVFLNILDNAIKYSYKRQTVEIIAEKHNEKICIAVHDVGIGFDEKQLPYIFNRFYRSKENVAGFGLGLNIAKKIIEAHGGSIEIKRRREKGTTVSIELPFH